MGAKVAATIIARPRCDRQNLPNPNSASIRTGLKRNTLLPGLNSMAGRAKPTGASNDRWAGLPGGCQADPKRTALSTPQATANGPTPRSTASAQQPRRRSRWADLERESTSPPTATSPIGPLIISEGNLKHSPIPMAAQAKNGYRHPPNRQARWTAHRLVSTHTATCDSSEVLTV